MVFKFTERDATNKRRRSACRPIACTLCPPMEPRHAARSACLHRWAAEERVHLPLQWHRKIKGAPFPCPLARSFLLFPPIHPIRTKFLSLSSPLHIHTYTIMADVEKTRAALRAKFDKITPEEFSTTQGNREKLVDLVADKYSISKEDATKQVDEAFSSA